MPGMGSGLNANNPIIVSSFKTTLLHQGLIALLILAVVAIVWQAVQILEMRRVRAGGVGESVPARAFFLPEAPARRLLRVTFGCLWIFDGLLQAQPKMPLGMTTGVIQPAAAASPNWVQHVANAGATIWSYHPIEAPASAVWIQVGIGLWLLVAPRGTGRGWPGSRRPAGGSSSGSSEKLSAEFFAPGLTWLFGAPGAVLFYAMAGVLVALPERWWASPRLGRIVLGVMGLFFIGMAILQAWPGRGFWQGQLPHSANSGTLAGMVQAMAQTPQPHVLSSWVSAFGALTWPTVSP